MTEQQNTRPSASREIAVKKLEWVKDPKKVSFVDAEHVDTFGLYSIAECVLFIGHTETGIPFDTVKEAKAAAQADYERRILSAIDNPGNTDPMLIAKYDDELRKVQGGWVDAVVYEARFLVDRLKEYEADGCQCDESVRQWNGHVSAPLARLEMALSDAAALRSLAQEGE